MNDFTYLTGKHHVRSRDGYYIGSSDWPTILGLSPKTPVDLYREKTGREKPFTGNAATWWGNELEGIILKNAIYEIDGPEIANTFFFDYSAHQYRRTGRWQPKTDYLPFTECLHPDHKWALAHADCVHAGKPLIIEAKSGGFFGNVRRQDMDGYYRSDPTASGVPFRVYFQVQWQSLCYGIPSIIVGALINTNDFSTYEIDANTKIQSKMLEAGSRFMWHLERDIPPTPRTFGDIQKLFPSLNDRRLTITGEQAAIAWDIKERLHKAKDNIKKYESLKKDYENALALLIGPNVELADEMGNKIASRSSWSQYNMLSPKKVQAECPEAFDLLENAGLIQESERSRIYA